MNVQGEQSVANFICLLRTGYPLKLQPMVPALIGVALLGKAYVYHVLISKRPYQQCLPALIKRCIARAKLFAQRAQWAKVEKGADFVRRETDSHQQVHLEYQRYYQEA